jgi:hypothetical protein
MVLCIGQLRLLGALPRWQRLMRRMRLAQVLIPGAEEIFA